MIEHPEPEWALVTILFVDIRGFTTFAERVTTRVAAAYLRDFFDVVVPVVRHHDGEINQMLGDGLLAVFRTPDHADRALAAGRAMLAATQASLGERCRIGVGLNSGLVLAGMIGGGGLSRFGLVGDSVNVAARVQDATRDLDEPLLLTQATRVLLECPQADLSPRGVLELRGKASPVAVYGLSVTDPGRDRRTTEQECPR